MNAFCFFKYVWAVPAALSSVEIEHVPAYIQTTFDLILHNFKWW